MDIFEILKIMKQKTTFIVLVLRSQIEICNSAFLRKLSKKKKTVVKCVRERRMRESRRAIKRGKSKM